MTGKSEQKSGKERWKEARSEKQKLRFSLGFSTRVAKKKKPAMPAEEPSPAEKKPKKEPAAVKKKRKRDTEGKGKPKSNFQEYLEMEMGGAVSMEEDLEMERRLGKKLKVKKGKLGGPNDGMDELFADLGFGGDFGSDDEARAYDWNVEDDTKLDRTKGKKKKKVKKDDMEMEKLDIEDEENDRKKKNKKVKKDAMETEEPDSVGEENGRKKKKKPKKKNKDNEVEEPDEEGVDMDEEDDVTVLESEDGEANGIELPTESKGKYVPPSLLAASSSESEEIAQMRRRVRGLLNRLSESNVESITQEIATLFRSVPRSVGSQIIGDEVLASCSRGPRGNEQYAAVFAAFVAGMACLVGIDFSAKILASIAKTFEDEYSKEDGLSLRNLTLLFCYLCIFGVISKEDEYIYICSYQRVQRSTPLYLVIYFFQKHSDF